MLMLGGKKDKILARVTVMVGTAAILTSATTFTRMFSAGWDMASMVCMFLQIVCGIAGIVALVAGFAEGLVE